MGVATKSEKGWIDSDGGHWFRPTIPLERLEHNYPGMFRKELMVTAFDVKYGKPNPEPYLMALKKGGLKADEAIVVENAPLGVEAGHNAGIFTIAVNTGPLDGQVLLDAGADLLLPSMQALSDHGIRCLKRTPKS